MDSTIIDVRRKETCKLNPYGYENCEKQIKLEGVDKLKFISYNVWFEKHNFEERNVELRKIFLKYDPDFICLQEVTMKFIQLLSKDEEICNKYYFSSPQVRGYDVLILSKYPIPFSCRYFPSEMGRNVLFGVINVNEIDIVIGTTHLESLEYNAHYRLCQLNAIKGQFEQHPESIFMGDFNLAKQVEDQNIPKQYIDVWKTLHPNDEGHTMQASKKYPSIRFDRVLLKESKNWKPTHIELIGKDPIPLYQTRESAPFEIVTPSDHYGIYVEISFNQNKQ